MSHQCLPPCLPPTSCVGPAAHADACPLQGAQSAHPCPELPVGVDACPCQGAPACLGDSHLPAVPNSAAWDPCVPLCVTAGVCPAAIACDPHQDQQGTSFPLQHATSPVEPCTLEVVGTCVDTFPLQHATSPVEPCTLEVVGTCVDTFPLQHATSPVEPCTLEVVGTCVDTFPLQPTASPVEPCCPQGVIACDPCPARCFVTHVDPCAPPSMICAEPCAPQSAAAPGDTGCPQQAPIRPTTRTAAIVERCLARCQNWLRGKK